MTELSALLQWASAYQSQTLLTKKSPRFLSNDVALAVSLGNNCNMSCMNDAVERSRVSDSTQAEQLILEM